LIWSHPGRIAGGQLNHSLVSSYDFFPTVLDYAGLETAPSIFQSRNEPEIEI
jgi:arylsulfatase A-like enzyme